MRDLHFLIADDFQDAADMLALIVQDRFPAASVEVAYDGPAALAAGMRRRPDVALLDLEMPRLPGEQVAAQFRAAYPDKAMRLVALSGNTARLDRLRPLALFDHLLSKPLDVEAMFAAIGT